MALSKDVTVTISQDVSQDVAGGVVTEIDSAGAPEGLLTEGGIQLTTEGGDDLTTE